MSHAAKYRKRAVEFEQLKQFDKAIASYIRAIDEAERAGEEVDVAVYNKVGDLTLRLGRVPDAVTYYERAVEHYASVGLFNNAIALCNKILRNAPGRSTIYFTLGRICAKKGLRGDASRNFLEYAARMRSEDRTEEAMRALAEVTELMPELTEVRGLVDEYATRAGIVLTRRATPARTESVEPSDKSRDLVFLDVNFVLPEERPRPRMQPGFSPAIMRKSLDDVMIFDPSTGDNGATSDSSVDDLENELALPPAVDAATQPTEIEQPEVIVEATVAGIERSDEEAVEAVAVSVDGLTVLEPESEQPDSVVAGPLEALTSRVDSAPLIVESIGLVSNTAEFFPEQASGAAGAQGVDETGTPFESIDRVTAFEPLAMERGEFDSTLLAEAVAHVEPLVVADEADALVSAADETLAVEPDPEIEAPIEAVVEAEIEPAIAASIDAAVEAPIEPAIVTPIEAVVEAPTAAPPFRLDPHNFILAGELPPLLIPNSLLRGASYGSVVDDAIAEANAERFQHAAHVEAEAANVVDAPETSAPGNETSEFPATNVPVAVADAVAAAEARHGLLARAVAEAPNDWPLRHRYAEALLEIGDREGGIAELENALAGFVGAGDLLAAFEVADELVQVGSHRIRHHQKRVELAVRLGDNMRLRISYLDLADALVRVGEDARAHAVYARVLEMDPTDERARMALGAAAPPLPTSQVEDSYVDLASWLKEEDGSSTRMRMHEPTITGDEQADFDALLRHFKEGVARSIGDDDHDSHYDLGVAYKEMGLLDDAVAEFQKALRSKVHRLPAYEALGQCFVEQGRHQVAVTVLSRALHEPGLDDGHRIGVLYLLGYSLEALQRTDDARSYFERVYATDNQFRDVAARLAALEPVAR